MVGSGKTCCIPECGAKHSESTMLHLFPHPDRDKQRFLTWVNAVGMTLSSLSPDYIYKNRRICSLHFQDKFKTWKGRLSNIAVPTLIMHGLQQNHIFWSSLISDPYWRLCN